MTASEQCPTPSLVWHALVWYAAAIVLTACYPNTFTIWQGLSLQLGSTGAAILPFAATAAVFLAAIISIPRRPNPPQGQRFVSTRQGWIYFAAGAVIALAGILTTDSDFPAKRIHIPQYFILALVVRRALSVDLPARWLFPAAVLLTAILGVHDELIQGLLPSRTFGLRDIGVNFLGALSGGAVGAGLCVFAAPTHKALPTPNRPTLLGIGAVVLGLGAMLAPLESFRDVSIPIWTVLPLLAAGVAVCLMGWRDAFSGTRPFAFFILITMTLPLYLMLSHANTLNFH